MPVQATTAMKHATELPQPNRRFHDPHALLKSLEGQGNPSIWRGLEVIRPILVSTDMLQVLEVFRDYQQEHFFPVLDAQAQPLGLVCERSLKGYVYSRFGMALLANRGQPKLLEHFLSACPTAELDDSTEQVLEKVHAQPNAEGVIITWQSIYIGFLRARALVELAHEQQLAIVHQHTATLDARNREIQAVLQNMQQGICIIQPDLTLHQDYSAHLTSILAQDNLGGQSVMSLLFARSALGADQQQQIEAALMAVLEQDALLYECNAHYLPTELRVDFPAESKLLELHWRPLLDADECVERLMLVVRDVTRMRALQAQADEQQRELQLLEEILGVAPDRFAAFLQQSSQCIAALLQTVPGWQPEDNQPKWLAAYRDVHTIKGNARTLGLLAVTDSLHAAEQALQAQDCLQLQAELDQVIQVLERYRRVHAERLSGYNNASTHSGRQIDAVLWDQLQLLAAQQKSPVLSELLAQAGVPLLQDWLQEITADLPRLADELGKPAPTVRFSGRLDRTRLRADCLPALAGALTHIMRNSLDHGIEPAEERADAGKPPAGALHWHGDVRDHGFVLSLADDGRGLNLARLADKAHAVGIKSAGDQWPANEVAELIFHPGLSTANSVSMTSGRGVGMDAVRASLEAMGGRISLELLKEEPLAGGCRPFRLHLHLPPALLLAA
ncbi:ATP-binding protein [Halopseudomonas salegens]|uniref:histidine kinase n=1 Tax=Halopseudomonas salegens TaxID=1434072 RepID=A0A1H2E6B4_9GAMM|nr:ATP-binding protein [Halopseudomonas salegens]SDT90529.1 Chemotaxis protein histidine kinase CheA [Halopseudomonas salegens]